MKKTIITMVLAVFAMSLFTSCVTSCDSVNAGERLPLVSHKLSVNNTFAAVENNTVIDIEFTQDNTTSAELLCPEEAFAYVVVNVEGGCLRLSLSDKMDREERNTVSRMLSRSHSKLYVKSPSLTGVLVNGSSTFRMTNDLRTDRLNVRLNGSGDIKMNGVQCKGDANTGELYVQLNGSGDVDFVREVKARAVTLQLNGSGDIDCYMVTSETMNTTLNGSGDVNVLNLTAVNSGLVLNGSGDLAVRNVKADVVSASLTGSGDIKLSGKCYNATYSLTNSGDISAYDLDADEVEAKVVGSGDICCRANGVLRASVSGSGDIRYKGNPDVAFTGKKENLHHRK